MIKKLLLVAAALFGCAQIAFAGPPPGIPMSYLGAPNGVPNLNGSSQVPIAQLPVGTSSGTVAAGNDGRFSANAAAAAAAANTANAAIPNQRLAAPSATYPLDMQNVNQITKWAWIGDSFVGHWAQWPYALPGSVNLSYVNFTQNWPQQEFHMTGKGYIPFTYLYGYPGDTSSANGSYPGIIPRLMAMLADPNNILYSVDAITLEGLSNNFIPCVVNGITSLCPLGTTNGVSDGGIYDFERGGAAILSKTRAILFLEEMPGRGTWAPATAPQVQQIEQDRLFVNDALRTWCAAQGPRCQWLPTQKVWTTQHSALINITNVSGSVLTYSPTTPSTPPIPNIWGGWWVYPLVGAILSTQPAIVVSNGSINGSGYAISTVAGSPTIPTGPAVVVQNGTPIQSLFQQDGPIHPNGGAAQILAQQVIDPQLGSLLAYTPFPCQSMADIYNPSINTSGVISNNCLLLGNNGTVQAATGTSGTVPANWVLKNAGSSTGTFTGAVGTISGVTGPFAWLNGDAEEVLAASRNASTGAAGEIYYLYQAVGFTSGLYHGGDIIHAECMMKNDTGHVNEETMFVQLYYPKLASGAASDSVDGGDSVGAIYPYYNSILDGQWQRMRSPSVIVGGEGAGTGSATGTVLTVSGMSTTYLMTTQGGQFQVGAELYTGTPGGALTDTGVALAATNTGTGTGTTGTYTLASALSEPAGTSFVAIGNVAAGSLQITPTMTLQAGPDAVATGAISTAGVVTVATLSSGAIRVGETVTAAGLTGGPYVVQTFGTNGTTGGGSTGSYQLSASPGSTLATTTIDLGYNASGQIEVGPCAIVKDPPGTLTMLWDHAQQYAANDVPDIGKE
jgi:hypothetical protein